MAAFAEFFAENFQSTADLTWDIAGRRVLAHFAIEGMEVEGQFEHRAAGEWLVSFETKSTGGEDYHRAFYVFNGVFQATEEFMSIREPGRVIFATKKEQLAHIYETYLRRERDRIEALGYRLLDPQKVEPFTEYVLERVRASGWN